MATLFISDLHLQPDRPALSELFLSFMAERAPTCSALFILGDLFEYWIGDDGGIATYPEEVAAIRQVSDLGVPVTFVPGNRDFLVGETFAAQSGVSIKIGVTQLKVEGQKTLILHGDELCTDDTAHQEFRKVALDPEVQAQMLALPLAQREQMAQALRLASKTGNKPSEIMDVNQQAVEDCMREHGLSRMIHGHTHRPAVHELELDGTAATRYVLTDWHDDRGGYLRCEGDEWSLEAWTG